MHELRGERTGLRYRLTDAVQVQVARVDLEARRIEFRLVTGTTFDALRKAATRVEDPASRRIKKAAAPKPPELKGQIAKVRRAQAQKAAKQETARAPKKAVRAGKSAGVKKSARKGR
jgi:ribonuclease R